MKKSLLSAVLICCASFLFSQDIHFSQFNASPLTLNPALTGKLECTYRAAINYRNQWNSVPAPYVTYSGAFDGILWKNDNGQGLGLGLLVFNDKSGDGNLTNLSLNGSIAMHKSIGEGHLLSAGFQATFVQKNVDINNLLFNNQIGPDGPIIGASNNENFQGGFSYFDVQAGLHWSSVLSDNFSFNLGGAYYHILEPTESFLGDNSNVLEARYVGHGGFSVGINDQLSLSPSVLYMQQSGATEINAGTSLGYHLDGASLYFGGWYRNKDAIIALAGVEFSNLTFGFSYDITTSDAAKATNGQGGFELSLTYNGCIEVKRKITHCPKF